MDKVDVIVRKRDGIVFQGKVFAVSSTNEVGDFDVLPGHANFICTIKNKVVIHSDQNNKKEYKIDTGILRAKDNKVEVYIGI
ncbi:MAG TPA: hypothetical protein VL401_03710 [Alphaproteobacteria bacterium]|jgi:F0F1-type ATP synthase epsilon subunit|nr:hypothetical protein [Alphaproteobacteria bacterium]